MRKIPAIILFGLLLNSCTESEEPKQLSPKVQFSNSTNWDEMYLDVVQIPPLRPISNPEFAKIMTTFTPIDDVSGNYTSETKLIDFSELECETWLESLTDNNLHLSFPETGMLKIRALPPTQEDYCFWPTPWGTPPAVEGPNPHIFFTMGQNSTAVSLSAPVNTFGFEVQPRNFFGKSLPNFSITVSAEFYSKGHLIGTITKPYIPGNPAQLFSAKTDASFDLVVIIMNVYNAGGYGFAIGQFRYTLADEEKPFTVDIKPESCENPVNVTSNGVIPVSILASEDLNVNDIDLSTIRMNGVAPQKSSIADIGGFYEKQDACDCDSKEMDGIMDLDLKFNTQKIVATLGKISDGEKVNISFSFKTKDGKSWTGEDCIRIIKKGNKK